MKRRIILPCILLALISASARAQNALYSGTVGLVSGNRIIDSAQEFTPGRVRNKILEFTSGQAAGRRFFITDATSTDLTCDTGMLNEYETSIAGAGVKPGDGYDVLDTELLDFGTGTRKGDFQMEDADKEWPADQYNGEYAYMDGTVGGTARKVLFEINGNTSTTLYFGPKLPAFAPDFKYEIHRNPSSIPPEQKGPQLALGTDAILTAKGWLRSIRYIVTPGTNMSLNVVDPYIAVLDPFGRLFFLRDKKWHARAVPMARGFVIGVRTEDDLGAFLLDPSLPEGRYVIYGVLNTPYADVYSDKYWRSRLESREFYIQ
ncbi:MAG: hypothetical protein PHN82_03290 [bacterium]|nr:hypothetical protein [bacterium]